MKEYYYLSQDNQRIGPFTLDELLAQHITSYTMIWKNGLAQWTAASSVPEVAERLTGCVPPPPPGTTNYDNIQTHRPPCPPTNLIWGILTTILCCLPLGVVAIYKSSQVERLYYNGDYASALKASQAAANWSIASLAISALCWFSYLGLIFMAIPFSAFL